MESVNDEPALLFGLDDGLAVGEAVDGRVVARLVPDERAGILRPGEAAQHLRQIRRADLAGSTGAVGERGEADDIGTGHGGEVALALRPRTRGNGPLTPAPSPSPSSSFGPRAPARPSPSRPGSAGSGRPNR